MMPISATTAENQYFIKNHLGSTVTLIDKNGVRVGPVYDYFAYGKQIEVITTPQQITQTFTGKEFDLFENDVVSGDDGEGLYYFGKRYYDAEIGRWISTDPTPQYVDLYNYCGDNPIGKLDKDGGWGSDFHYDKTFEIGTSIVGKDIAQQIAFWDNDFDNSNNPVKPYWPNSNRKYHFQSKNPVEYLKNRKAIERDIVVAAKNHDLKAFSGLLHQEQDLSSHASFGDWM